MSEHIAENDAGIEGIEILHLPSPDGQACRISVNGQGHLPCALTMVEPCACPEGPYQGARQAGRADTCERCGRLTTEQIEHIVWKFGTRPLPPEVSTP